MCDNNNILEGMYKGIGLMSKLIKALIKDGKESMIPKMAEDTELAALLMKQYNLISEDDYDFLSDKADEEWEANRTPVDFSQLAGMLSGLEAMGGLAGLGGAEDITSLDDLVSAPIPEPGSLGSDDEESPFKITDGVDRERELRIKLLEVLSDECEYELYNEIAMGLDDDLFEELLKKYNIS